ncbi:MAG: NAD(P)H-hydrate dehydratase [Patescibacteria group bacterium]
MDIKSFYKERDPLSHKGDFGTVLIVAGSERYTGSAIFNAVSALHAGADLVTVISHKRAADIASSFLPDIISLPLNEELERGHSQLVLEEAENADVLIIGGGLKRSLETSVAIRKIVEKTKIPMVIDAEAIRALAEEEITLESKRVIITPHAEEFRILNGNALPDEQSKREEVVRELARKISVTILLKSGIDIISDGEAILTNETGTPFMTKGGFGDNLAGICGALLARNPDSFESAYLGAYINGKAGERASEIYGESVLASDTFEVLSQVIEEVIIRDQNES